MEISVIVPTLNEEMYLERCLRSIISQSYPRKDYEIIVSDGGSSDKTVEIAKKYADKVVVSKKKGIWWGRNYGAKFAKGKYLVFIDADTSLKRRYLEEIHELLMDGYVGISSGFGLTGNDQKTRVLEELVNYYWMANSKVRNNPLIGFNVAVPRSAFDRIGGFKRKNVEDEQLNRDLAKVGDILFLKKRLVVTSTRRLQDYGFFGICRYYLDLILVDNKLVKGNPYGKFLKHKKYEPAGRA